MVVWEGGSGEPVPSAKVAVPSMGVDVSTYLNATAMFMEVLLLIKPDAVVSGVAPIIL